MCGRGRLFPDTEQPPQNAPHAAGCTPHHDLHALTSCHASTPRRRRSAETPPETSGTPPETRRRSGCPVPAPARRSPETSFRRHIVARYIPPLLQYMKEWTRRAWRGGVSGTPSPTGAQQKQRGAPCGAPRVFRPCVAQTEEGYIRRLMQAGTALSTLIWKQRCTRYRRWSELRTRPCSRRRRSWCQRLQPGSWTDQS